MKTALERKYQKLADALGEQSYFYMDEVQRVFPDMKKSYLYWNISKLVEEGYLKRVRNGVYAFDEWKEAPLAGLEGEAAAIKKLLDETGFDYYISGLDILGKYMHHVPEQYPIIVFIRKETRAEISEELKKHHYGVLEPLQIKKMQDTIDFAKWVVLYQTENYEWAEDGQAATEKAFVDLYYAVTRNDYPLALQELARIFKNMVRRGGIDTKKMIAAAARRSIQYDIRYIIESRHITEQAINFAKLLEREE